MTNTFDAIANDVMPRLVKMSDVFVEWTFEYPGFIALHLDGGGLWNIGTANGTWGADLYVGPEIGFQDAPDKSIDTGISADSEDAQQIADALYRAMTEVR